MITYIAKLINLFAVSIQNVFRMAWLIGKLIVELFTEISTFAYNLIGNVLLFFQIVYEDNIFIFTEDLPNLADNIVLAISGQWTLLQSGVAKVYRDMNYKIGAILGSVQWMVNTVTSIVWEVLCLFKNAIILMGDALWFILTFIPIQLPLLLRTLVKTITELVTTRVVDAYMSLLKITNFLTDVPLESFIGIISAIVIIRLYIHFKQTIQSQITALYWSAVRNLWYYYYAIYNYFVDPDVREITLMSSGHEVQLREDHQSQAGVVDDGSAADALCVICQERQKCVLTLPCRHICLCTECCMRLYGYQRTCPICRTFIYHSVTVYL